MADPLTRFVDGETTAIDYTPDADVTGGDVVVIGNTVFFAKLDIDADDLGALHVGGVWDVPKSTGTGETWTAGDTVYWDAENEVATASATGNEKIGICVLDAAADDEYVRVLSIPQA